MANQKNSVGEVQQAIKQGGSLVRMRLRNSTMRIGWRIACSSWEACRFTIPKIFL